MLGASFQNHHLETRMRFTTKIMTVAAAVALATSPIDRAPMLARATIATTLQDSQGVKIDVNTTERHSEWYTHPVWIAIGVIAFVLIIALIAMAGRRNTTTVVK